MMLAQTKTLFIIVSKTFTTTIGEGLNALGFPILDEAQSTKYIAL